MTFFDLRESFRRRFRPSQQEKMRALESREIELGEKEKLVNMRLKLAEKEAELAHKEELIVKAKPAPKMASGGFGNMLRSLTSSSLKANQDFMQNKNLTTITNAHLAQQKDYSEDILGLNKTKKVKLL